MSMLRPGAARGSGVPAQLLVSVRSPADRLFAADHEDGSLDLLVMSRTPLEITCIAKALAHWIASGIPLIVATPVLGLMLNLEGAATVGVMVTLLASATAYHARVPQASA